MHDRPELTLRTIGSYLDTTRETETLLVIVDSGSGPDTRDLLDRMAMANMLVRRFDANVYPGRACNHGWEHALALAPDITHLHRSDNDVEYQAGWADEVEAAFTDPTLGQLGLLEERYEQGAPNVGGNSVISRDLWAAGLRWDETAWAPGIQEDGRMSTAVRAAGRTVSRVGRECVRHLGWDFDAYPGYYRASAAARGLDEAWLRDHFDRMRSLCPAAAA